jgi:hypothetical protein
MRSVLINTSRKWHHRLATLIGRVYTRSVSIQALLQATNTTTRSSMSSRFHHELSMQDC